MLKQTLSYTAKNRKKGSGKSRKAGIAILLILASALLIGAGAPAPDEQGALAGREKTLEKRIAALEQEQEYLLFLNSMYSADSKYLLLDPAGRKGQLRYKNRVLKDFRLRIGRAARRSLRPGPAVLTEKGKDRKDRRALLFGTAFVLRGVRSAVPPRASGVPAITVSRKDLLSVYYAVEAGAMAYIRPPEIRRP